MIRDTYINETGALDVSTRYQAIATKKIVDKISDYLPDWTMTSYKEAGVRKKEKIGKQKHQVSWRRNTPIDGELTPTINLLNSYDRTQSLQLSCGLFRFWCANGLIIGADWGSFKMRHLVGTVERSGITNFLDTLPVTIEKSCEVVARMKDTPMPEDLGKIHAICSKSLKMTRPLLTSEELVKFQDNWIMPRRSQDKDSNLWCAFNRVQEAVVKGGYGLRTVKALEKTSRVNKYLWNAFADLAIH